ncbi:adenylyl-sulfate kinase [Hazenella sp. IB182357]|uniref:Adenylyl-sulfate kinase n=1 Tax=Polycladospora coralii TaxID=2771432 RepID=A0A926NAC9_9BACL|nr:adenylyl-sulfate kinase [Polycladospora coralii]MBD1371570.1 adenylyl-sulfate kinase [Polycladospora coralii]MBS7529038.1 adenylyl-sulfate kinase [Polycladospora coralii]
MNKGAVFWLTGLSGAGKTTIAKLVEEKLNELPDVRVQLLDGDILRDVINSDLGFTKEDRFKQIQRGAFIAQLLMKQGVLVLCSFITPYRFMRDYCRQRIDQFHEIYVKCPLEACIERDVKGLYKKAIDGEITQFTGISDPYETPLQPDMMIETATEVPEVSAEKLFQFIRKQGYIS